MPVLSETPAILVGHSLGALVVLGAAAGGAAVSRLVLLDPAGIGRLRVSTTVMRPTLPWLRTPNHETSEALLRMMSAPGTTPSADQVEWMTLVGRHARTSLAPAPMPDAELAQLPDVPTTVLSGRHDAFLPAKRFASRARRRLPTTSLHIIEDAGHLLPHERPDIVLQHLTNGPAERR